MTGTLETLPVNLFDACPLPDVDLLAKYRRDISERVTSQSAFYLPDLRQQLLAVLGRLSLVDAGALRLIDGIDVCLSTLDITPYMTGIATLDKPGRTEQENVAFLHYQHEMARQLSENVILAKAYLVDLDTSLASLHSSVIEDGRAAVQQLQRRLEVSGDSLTDELQNRLNEWQGAREVHTSRAGYVHEVSKLVFAVSYFFDHVLEGSPNVIQRAEDFLRHSDALVAYLRNLRKCWIS